MTPGELYDLRTARFTADHPAIEALVAGHRTLEVGCGTGRVLQWLVGQGAESVVGIDIDADKLAVAQGKPGLQRAPELQLLRADLLTFASPQRFERVLFAFNVLTEFLTVEAKILALRTALHHLEPGGEVVTITTPHDFASYAQQQISHSFELTAPHDIWEATLICQRQQIEQRSQCEIEYRSRATGERIRDRWHASLTTRNELLAVYQAAGAKQITEFGTYDLKPLTADSQILIHVLRPE